ncbi:GNAT family N-acetyltransferase [Nocardioides mangrovicus]|uniref:GNAT family N-acetyltransferase n=1 Tax=Nocardioides mangrovicus TaxID=2478913 RepID=A0A3L8P3E7_9ACTN|nr:GNAT family N-acetyltransferase [Nocardioides mangrovicus]RLV49601.1 GNAT family N-acetyltransferase [Nocardioides mangrovicus]
MILRPARDDEWPVLEWLWQAYGHDLSEFRDSYPRPDGRFTHDHLDRARGTGTAYLALTDPGQGRGEVPVGFSLVTAGERGEWHMMAFFVTRRVRRTGLGRDLALETIRRHPGPWEIAFQEENPRAASFWRRIADEAFPDGWREERRPVPGKPEIPPDVWIIGG